MRMTECSNPECMSTDVIIVYCVEYNEFLRDKYLYQCHDCKRVWVE
jgi:transposase-like protein